jgi:hypothetical protein
MVKGDQVANSIAHLRHQMMYSADMKATVPKRIMAF